MKVSVIVPVCNVEKYLPLALDSAINQTLTDIEIICIDDGSTDSSGQILDEYAQRDARIKVIHKENSGYGHTMNVGLDMAQGEYIAVLESDDWIQPYMLQDQYEAASAYDVDVVKADFGKFTAGDGEEYFYTHVTNDSSLYECVWNAKEMEKRSIFFAAAMTWTGIVKRSFLQENNIRHNETPGASYQDNGFWFQLITQAHRVYFLPKLGYMYRQNNPNSSVVNRDKLWADNEEYAFIYSFLKHKKLDKFLPYYWMRKYMEGVFTLNRIWRRNKSDFLKHFYEEFRAAQVKKELDLTWFPTDWADEVQLLLTDREAYGRKMLAKELGYEYQEDENAPEVSLIVLPCADEKAYRAAVQTLTKQKWRNFELIFIDDGSKAAAAIWQSMQKANYCTILKPATDKWLLEALAQTKGRYVGLLSGYDCVVNVYTELLHKVALEQQADIISGGYAWAKDGRLTDKISFAQWIAIDDVPEERLSFEVAHAEFAQPIARLYRRALFDNIPAAIFTGIRSIDYKILHLWAALQSKKHIMMPHILLQRSVDFIASEKHTKIAAEQMDFFLWQLKKYLNEQQMSGLHKWLITSKAV